MTGRHRRDSGRGRLYETVASVLVALPFLAGIVAITILMIWLVVSA